MVPGGSVYHHSCANPWKIARYVLIYRHRLGGTERFFAGHAGRGRGHVLRAIVEQSWPARGVLLHLRLWFRRERGNGRWQRTLPMAWQPIARRTSADPANRRLQGSRLGSCRQPSRLNWPNIAALGVWLLSVGTLLTMPCGAGSRRRFRRQRPPAEVEDQQFVIPVLLLFAVPTWPFTGAPYSDPCFSTGKRSVKTTIASLSPPAADGGGSDDVAWRRLPTHATAWADTGCAGNGRKRP